MERISEDFHDFDMQKAMQLAQTDAARQLYAMLQAEGADKLQSAMDQAATGDMTQAKQTLQQLLSSEQARQLLRSLQERSDG